MPKFPLVARDIRIYLHSAAPPRRPPFLTFYLVVAGTFDRPEGLQPREQRLVATLGGGELGVAERGGPNDNGQEPLRN